MKVEISQESFNDLMNLSELYNKSLCEMLEYLIAASIEDIKTDSCPVDDIIKNKTNKSDEDIKKIVEMFKFGGIDIKI